MRHSRTQIGVYTATALLAGALIGLNQLRLMSAEQYTVVMAPVGSPAVLALIAGVQSAVLALVSSAIGVRLAPRVGLRTTTVTVAGGWSAVVIASALALVIVASDAWVFDRYLPAQAAVGLHWLGLLSSVLYGGIVEEVWLRLGVMTLMVWGLGLSLRRHFALDQLPAWVFWVATGASALLFAAGHLPVTFALLCPASGDCTPLIVRALLLNGIGGLGFGYLFWRHGLIAAMVAHMLTHICMQVVFGPLLLG
jgi:hypothetical protein